MQSQIKTPTKINTSELNEVQAHIFQKYMYKKICFNQNSYMYFKIIYFYLFI